MVEAEGGGETLSWVMWFAGEMMGELEIDRRFSLEMSSFTDGSFTDSEGLAKAAEVRW